MASNISVHNSRDAAPANNNSSISSERIASGSSSRREMNAQSTNSVQKRSRQSPQPTTLTEYYLFDYEMPRNYVPQMDDQVSQLVSLGYEHWLPFDQRLTGWTKEVRTRASGARDHFYYHGNIKFRTFKDVKRYLYLGYPPLKENADEPLERWALEQPNPLEKLTAMAPTG